MLILTRKKGESILIGSNIKIVYVGDSFGSEIKLGIDAPKDILIIREELKNNQHIDI